MLYPTLKLVISMQDELLLRDVTNPTKLHRNQLRHDPESRIRYALGRTTEVIDQAYNLARMRLAGVNLTADSPYLTYQHFYDRGMAPPTHQEMADAAISDLR